MAACKFESERHALSQKINIDIIDEVGSSVDSGSSVSLELRPNRAIHNTAKSKFGDMGNWYKDLMYKI